MVVESFLNNRYGEPMSVTPQHTPPGWYPNQSGETQWWDGNAWGPIAPQQAPQQVQAQQMQSVVIRTQKSMAVAYVLLIFLGGFGVHRFYVDNVARAVWMLVLTLVSIAAAPFTVGFSLLLFLVVGIMCIIDLFTLAGAVRRYNERVLAM